MTKPHLRILASGFIAVTAMSIVPVLVKSTVANEVTISIVRLGIAFILFTPWAIFHLKSFSKRDWISLSIIGAVFALHWFSYFTSIKLATPTISALAISTYGVQYLVLAWLFNGDRFAMIEWIAVAVCFFGCTMVVPNWSLDNDTSRGILIGLFSALLYDSLPLLHQKAVQNTSILNNTLQAWGQFGFALLCFLPFWKSGNWQLQPNDWYGLIVLGVVSTVIAHGLWIKVTKELAAPHVSMMYYLYVPLAMLQSVCFLDESISTEKILGASMIVSSNIGISIYRATQVRHFSKQAINSR